MGDYRYERRSIMNKSNYFLTKRKTQKTILPRVKFFENKKEDKYDFTKRKRNLSKKSNLQ